MNKRLARSPKLQPRGFTLVELLIVLVVMGISLGMVVVQLMPDDRTMLHEEAARLALLIENAGLEARSSGRSMAWSSEKTRYLFWKKNDYNDWARIEDDAAFRPRTLPEGMQINEISVEDRPVKHGEHLALSASSFALPFRIRMSNATANTSVVGKSTGEVIVESNDAN
ncbi:MAG: prepilin-type N-terminal cleavage/methylation domain-containing protein [Gallionellaceae bacterium]|jgi:general secretion pathway protein H